MNTTPANAIDLSGQTIQGLQVLDYAFGGKVCRGEHWWVLCLACHHQQTERGGNLRRALKKPGFRVWCQSCGR